MNLAFIGFFVSGLVFAIYAFNFYSLAGKKLPVFLKSYAFAYLCLALAFLIWAFAALSTGFLKNSVLIGDGLVLLGSIFMLSVIFNQSKSSRLTAVVLGVIFAVFFVWLRVNYFAPVPYLQNGVLVFNTQATIRFLLYFIFALIWLPANLIAAKKVTENIRIDGIRYAYSFIYLVSTIAAILFITFKTVPMVVLSFVTLGICFLMLIYSNYLMNKMLSSKQ